MATPYAIVELETVESTQDEARARSHRRTPILVIAEKQTAGRGRLGRTWVEPDRALFSSLAFNPSWPTPTWGPIPLVAGLAARDATEEQCGVTIGLRWPNDLVTEKGKIGGLLVESRNGIVVVGCGINLAWNNPLTGAAALFGRDSDAVAILWWHGERTASRVRPCGEKFLNRLAGVGNCAADHVGRIFPAGRKNL